MPQPPEPGRAAVLHTSAGDDRWFGFPFDVHRSAPRGSWGGEAFGAYWLSVRLRGRCAVRLRAGSRTDSVTFSEASFCGYPPGVHWDHLTFEGSIETVNFSFCPRYDGPAQIPVDDALEELSSTFRCTRDPQVHALAATMVDEFLGGSRCGRLYGESLSLALMARLTGLQREMLGRRSSSRSPKLSPASMRRLAEFIDCSLAENLGIERLASIAGLSPSHFAVCFRNSFDTTVHRYVLSRRIDRARRLIESSHSLLETAVECGFSTQSRFTESFRQATGETPGRYRARLSGRG